MVKNKFSAQKILSIFILIFVIGIVFLNWIYFFMPSRIINNKFIFITNIAYIFFLILFLSATYLIYGRSIILILKSDKKYKDIIINLSAEKNQLENEISSHIESIQNNKECIISLEQKLNKICPNKASINLEKFYITAMELNVIRELCLQSDLTNKEIAFILGLKTGTVKQHMNKVFKKLDISSRQELAARCSCNFNDLGKKVEQSNCFAKN